MNTFTLESGIPNDARVNNDQVECPRCRKGEALPIPMPLSALTPWLMYFRIKHRWCKKS